MDTLVASAPPTQLELGRRRYERFAAFLAVSLAAYLLFDRAAAYIHIPGTPVFLGEACLAVGLWAFVRARWYVWGAIRGDAVLCALLAFFLWGTLRTLTNLRLYGVTWTLRDSALWYYSLFAVLVVAAALAIPRLPSLFATKLGRLVPWMAVCLPIAVLLSPAGANPAKGGGSGRVHIRVPFSTVSIVSHKDGNIAIAAFVGLLALWLLPHAKRSVAGRRVWSFLLLATVLFAGTQNRGGLVAVTAATVVGAFLIQGFGRRVLAMVVVVALSFIGLSFWFPHLGAHSARSVSPTQLQSNVESLVGKNNQIALNGTVADRKVQWSYVLNLQKAQNKMVYGWGPGPNLGFGKATGIGDASLRSAHNSHLDVLARLGYVGLGLWIFVWLVWFWRMFTGRSKLQRAGLDHRRRLVDVCLLATIAIVVNAFFDPSLESAQAAILLWTLFGFGAVLTNPRWFASVG